MPDLGRTLIFLGLLLIVVGIVIVGLNRLQSASRPSSRRLQLARKGMVGLLPSGDFYSHQCVAEPPSLGDQPPAPLTLKSCFTMLDSGGMSESDNKPPTLASLRARRGKLRVCQEVYLCLPRALTH